MNPIERALREIDKRQQRSRAPAFVFAVMKKYGDDMGGNLAALLTYYAFLAIFPLLLVLVTVLGLVLHGNASLQHKVLNSALTEFPVIGPTLKNNVHSLSGNGFGLAVGIVLTLLGARGVASAFQNAMNVAWQVPKSRWPGFPFNQLRSLGILAVGGLGVIVTGGLSGIGGGGGSLGAATRIGVFAGALAINVGVFAAVFRMAAAKSVATRALLPGAVMAAIAWTVLLGVGGYVVAHQLKHSTEVYGTFGLVIGLLAWLYLQAEVTLYAVEADVVRCKRLWPRSITQPPLTPADQQAYQGYVTTEARRPEQRVDVGWDPAAHHDPLAAGAAGKPEPAAADPAAEAGG